MNHTKQNEARHLRAQLKKKFYFSFQPDFNDEMFCHVAA